MKAFTLALAMWSMTLPYPVEARTYPPIGTPAYSAGCTITHEWEDGSAIAYCPEDGETWAFDADGGFAYLDGMRWYYRAPGTWFVAPERWQEGPGAR